MVMLRISISEIFEETRKNKGALHVKTRFLYKHNSNITHFSWLTILILISANV